VKPNFLLPVFIIALSGCASVPSALDAWKGEDFARASDAETVEIAAACLRHNFTGRRVADKPSVIYLDVKNADWRAVVGRAKLEFTNILFRGDQDHLWSDVGFRDRETGLRAVMWSIEVKRLGSEQAQVFESFNRGTNLGSSSNHLILEKRDGAWKVTNEAQGPTS
jgi:hypothetical protein